MKNIYYCYIYLDSTKPGIYNFKDLTFEYEPFYVGKGKNTRAFVHLKYVKRRLDQLKSFNYHFYNKIKKILLNGNEPIILFFKKELFEEDAYDLETKLIETIGLVNLTNLFPGGKGGRNNKNFSGRHHTEETKKRLSENHKGNKNPMYGDKYFRSKEGIQSFSKKTSKEQHTYFNKHRNEETKQKISEKLQGYEWPKIEKEKRSKGMKKVWEERKTNNIIIKNKGTSKNLKAIHLLINLNELIFKSQKECSKYFSMDFRTIRKKIESNETINNYKLLWT